MLGWPDTVRNASRPKKSCARSTLPFGVRGGFARSNVDTPNNAPTPCASDAVMTAVLTQKNPFSSKKRWIACARRPGPQIVCVGVYRISEPSRGLAYSLSARSKSITALSVVFG